MWHRLSQRLKHNRNEFNRMCMEKHRMDLDSNGMEWNGGSTHIRTHISTQNKLI